MPLNPFDDPDELSEPNELETTLRQLGRVRPKVMAWYRRHVADDLADIRATIEARAEADPPISLDDYIHQRKQKREQGEG